MAGESDLIKGYRQGYEDASYGKPPLTDEQIKQFAEAYAKLLKKEK